MSHFNWIFQGFFDVEKEVDRLEKKIQGLEERIAQHKKSLAKHEKKGKQSKRKQDILEKVLKWLLVYEPCHQKTCFCHMRTTKVQISLRIREVWSAPLLFAA